MEITNNHVDNETFFSRTHEIKELAKKIADKLNLVEPRYLDNGHYGIAFTVGNRILKITRDPSEYVNGLKLINQNPRYLPNIYLARKIMYNGMTLYVILLEKIEVTRQITNKFNKELQDMYYFFGQYREINNIEYYDPTLQFYRTSTYDKDFLKYLSLKNRDAYKFIIEIFYIIKEMKKYGIKSNDIHGNNIGIKNRHYCYFDLGASSEINSHAKNVAPEMIHEKNIIQEKIETQVLDVKLAEKVYNKILKNLNNIKFEPVTESLETVKKITSTFSMTTPFYLHGIKFNLSQIIPKLDINILFIEKLTANDRTSAFYYKKKNFLGFILFENIDRKNGGKEQTMETYIQLANIRFKSWIPQNIFVHEFMHYLNGQKYLDKRTEKTYPTKEKYFNNPEETNAFFKETLSNILKSPKLFQLPFKKYLPQALSFFRTDFIGNLDKKNKQKLLRKLFDLYNFKNNSA